MNIKSYKQYLADDKEGKIICGIKTATIQEVYELTDNRNKQIKDSFRPMRMLVIDFDDDKNIGNYVETEYIHGDLIAGTNQEAQSYMRIFFGKMLSWCLVKVNLYEDGLLLEYYRYGTDGAVVDFIDITLSIPKHITLQIDIDADDQHPAEMYRITMEADKEKSQNLIGIEYLVEGKKQYTAYLDHDERGLYEFITEA